MGDRVPGRAELFKRVPERAVQVLTSSLSNYRDEITEYPLHPDDALDALSAALDACPVIGLSQEELDALLHPEPWAVKNRARHAALSKLRAALRSVSEANDG